MSCFGTNVRRNIGCPLLRLIMSWAMLVLNVSELEALVKNCAQSPIFASGISYGEFVTF